ncbi:MAG TPA: GNAT family N-acetyltransferase [Micromonosporaceae bacterium]
MPTVDVVTTISAVAPEEWNALCHDRAFLQYRWLRLAELVLAGHQPRYLLVRRRGTLVAAAVGSLERRLQNPMLEARLGWLVRRSPFLLVAAPMTATSGLVVGDGVEQQAQRGALLDAVRDFVQQERSPFCIIDHLPERDPAIPVPRGYCRLKWLPDTRLDLSWASFEDYLADLPRKKRQEIRRIQRRAEHEGIVVKPLAPTADLSPTLDRLVAEVVRHHGGTRHYAPELFVTAAEALGDDLTVLGAHRHGRLAGCVALLRSGEEAVVRWIGRDYEHTTGTSIYHALVTACVRHAIVTGVRRLHFGGAAYATKQQFGVSLEPRTRLFAARSAAVTWLMGRLSHRFDPPALPS